LFEAESAFREQVIELIVGRLGRRAGIDERLHIVETTARLTPGILWRLEAQKLAPVQSFAVMVRKAALGNSLRRKRPA